MDKSDKQKGRSLSRRGFFAITSVSALGLILWDKIPAFAIGVGGGAYGNYDGTCDIGATAGYAGGWSYSGDGTCWLSICVEGGATWGSELYTDLALSTYYACGGVWPDTWFGDFDDVELTTGVENVYSDNYDTDTWLDSKWQMVDAAYDTNSYIGPFCTDSFTTRKSFNNEKIWLCARGACPYGHGDDNARGIDAWVSVPLWLCGHGLVHDTRPQTQVFEIVSHALEDKCLEIMNGSVSDGAVALFRAPNML